MSSVVELEAAWPARRRTCAPGRWTSGVAVLVGQLLAEHLFELVDQLAEGRGDLLVALRSRLPSASFSNFLRSSSDQAHPAGELLRVDDDPSTPEGTSSESFFTSSPARPKIACSSFSSGVSSVFDLRRDLADQDVARLHERADPDDAVLVEVAQRLLADVGNVAGELLAAELRLANFDVELFDVNRRVGVVLAPALR